MTGESIFFEIGNIEEHFILNSAPDEKRPISKRSVISVAACLVLSACVVLSVLIYGIAKEPSVFERAIWAEDIYQNFYVGNDGTDIDQREVHMKWEIAVLNRYEGYTVSYLLYEHISNAKDGDVFAVIVTDADFGSYGTEELEHRFSEEGICTVVKDGELYLFLTKEELSSLELDEENKGKLIFVFALREIFMED